MAKNRRTRRNGEFAYGATEIGVAIERNTKQAHHIMPTLEKAGLVKKVGGMWNAHVPTLKAGWAAYLTGSK